MTIEEAINQAAREGRLSLTVFAASQGFQASLSLDKKGWRVEMGADPATALKKVLGLLPGAAGRMRETEPGDIFA
jgi:hypothetical protein